MTLDDLADIFFDAYTDPENSETTHAALESLRKAVHRRQGLNEATAEAWRVEREAESRKCRTVDCNNKRHWGYAWCDKCMDFDPR
jgi:hypothetical protein